MALFGSSRDISFMIKVNNELLDDIIQQEVDYYKLYIPETKSNDTANLYGEASAQKTYYRPVRLTCLKDRTSGTQAIQDDQFGIDITQNYIFRFLQFWQTNTCSINFYYKCNSYISCLSFIFA